ncbi:MAG TPA: hypothetical protein PJ986_15805 [Gammaproteobacteria bacterium]|nr:hypothetical protein [Gammaproteobacteria bacterium]
MNRLEALIETGASPLWLEADAYAARLLARDAAPWLDSSAYIAWHRKMLALLEPGIAAVNITPILVAWTAHEASTLRSMQASRRAVAPFKHLLADPLLRAHLLAVLTGLRASYPGLPLALTAPSPHRGLLDAYRNAFGGTPEYCADDVDTAAMYLADFLRTFGEAGIELLLLEESPDSAPATDEALALYQAVLNVAAHLRWGIGLRQPAGDRAGMTYPGIDFVIGPACAGRPCRAQALGPEFWEDDRAPAPQAGVLRYAEVPVDAIPERVLARLDALRR